MRGGEKGLEQLIFFSEKVNVIYTLRKLLAIMLVSQACCLTTRKV